MRKLILCVLVAFIAMTPGCKSKLNEPVHFDLEPGGDHISTIPAIKNAQNVQVTGKTTGAPINVYIFLQKNEAAAKKEINSHKPAANVLKMVEKTDTIDLEAAIPADETAVVYCTPASSKKTSVDLQLTNR